MSISRVYKIVNDVDDLIYIGSTKQILCRRMTEHRRLALKGRDLKLYNHMREIGAEHFKILCVREYKDISKERLRYKEDKYIKRFDSVKKGLNMLYAFGGKCEHNVARDRCKDCIGSGICPHNKQKWGCKEWKGSSICLHNKEKQYCKECGGRALCLHDKQRKQCKICSPAVCDICSNIFSGKSNLKTHQRKCRINLYPQ